MLNRNTKLYTKSVKAEDIANIPIPERFMAALFPKFSPNGRYLAYIGVPQNSLSHTMATALVVYDLETFNTKIVLDVVNDYNEVFNGIYGYHETLSTYNWLNDNRIVFGTPHNASDLIFSTDLEGNVSAIDLPIEKPYSSAILDVFQGTVLLKASNLSTPDKVFTATKEEDWVVTLIENTAQEPRTTEENLLIDSLKQSQISLVSHKNSFVKSVLIHSSNNKNLLINIHGGPHGTGLVSYNAATLLRLVTGFNVLVVNYRGSTGFGDFTLKSLLGNIGSFDVEDCIEAINLAKEITNPEKIVSSGGSHGGFLSLHLACSYPLNASIVINAVTDISSMCLTSDITDWPFAEVIKSNPVYPPTAEHLQEMYKVSPISRLTNVQCPVLLIAGGADMRVPGSETKEVFKVLKANNKDVKFFWYPDDGHGLVGKATTFDLFANSLLWLIEKTNN